jgi:uncharacterized protein (DUF924 family)
VTAPPADVLAFWREAGHDKWFNKDTGFDDEISTRFLDTYEAAAVGKLLDWETTREGALALVVVLDQFPRNMFRGNVRAFAADPFALSVARRALLRAVPHDRRCRPPEVGGTARRHHPPFRPLPAPQRRARPHHHSRRADLPG